MPLTPAYELGYRADMSILILRWQRPASFRGLQAACWAALDLAHQHRCGCWLFDARRREQLDQQFMNWLSGDFIAAAMQQLAPVRFKLGIISSPRHLIHFNEAVVAFHTAPVRPLPCQAYVSMEEGQTLRWLLADG